MRYGVRGQRDAESGRSGQGVRRRETRRQGTEDAESGDGSYGLRRREERNQDIVNMGSGVRSYVVEDWKHGFRGLETYYPETGDRGREVRSQGMGDVESGDGRLGARRWLKRRQGTRNMVKIDYLIKNIPSPDPIFAERPTAKVLHSITVRSS